jgi:hypothetical protein
MNGYIKEILIVLSMYGCNAFAQQPVQIMGPSSLSSCGEFVAARARLDNQAKHDIAMIVSWVWGYSSRYNVETKASSISIPENQESVALFIEKFCRENPLQQVIFAADKMIIQLGGQPYVPRKK